MFLLASLSLEMSVTRSHVARIVTGGEVGSPDVVTSGLLVVVPPTVLENSVDIWSVVSGAVVEVKGV